MRTTLVLLALCVFLTTAQAQRIKVDVQISSENAGIEAEVRSYISRELRSLGDVDIADDSVYSLYIVVTEPTLSTDPATHRGYVLSYSFIEIVTCSGEEIGKFLQGSMITGGRDSIPTLAKRIVLNFDTKVLEARRAKYRRAK